MGRSLVRTAKRTKRGKISKLTWERKRNEISDGVINQNERTSATDVEAITCSFDEENATDSLLDTSELKKNPKWCSVTYSAAKKRKTVQNSFETTGIMQSDEYNSIANSQLCYESERKKPSPIMGNRIVDLNYVLEWSVPLQYKHSKICTSGELYVKSESRVNKGLASTITFNCTMCSAVFEYCTENPREPISKINYGAVWGTLATGSTYGHLEELLSCIDIPVMPDNIFYDIENKVGEEWRLSLWRSMKAAGIKERNYAIEIGKVCPDGTPWIRIYVDGSWAKRSYGTNFNSNSGMVAIIGQYTGEILFIAIRNKYCSICARAENKNEAVKEHRCYKNWSSSAPAMESDMVVEGFLCSEEMHGLKYLEFVADADSSVYAKIKAKVPYGQEVRKIECTNHALKNYGKNLRKVKADTHINNQGRKLLTGNKIDLLTKRARCSIYEHAKSDSNDVEELRQQLKNGLQHVFGNHLQCTEGTCNSIGDTEHNLVPELEATGIFNHLYGVLNLLVRKAHLLIQNENNNRAERLMNIVARFNMGKRLNLIQRGSYERRVNLSGLRHNKSFAWHVSPWKKCVGSSPGRHFKIFIKKHQQKKITCRKNLFPAIKNSKRSCKKPSVSKNADYGQFANEPEDIEDSEFILKEAKQRTLQLQVSTAERNRIQCETVGQFGNKLYEYERHPRLTASIFGNVVKRRQHTSCHNLVKSCLNPNSFYSMATEYGISKETVAASLFEKVTGEKVQKSGLWIDEDHGFLAASPDGLIGENAILEIKCIYLPDTHVTSFLEVIEMKKSKICLKKTENNEIQLNRNHNYYYQVQGQLNITKKEKCYFVVYINDRIPLFIEEIYRNEQLWNNSMLPKLQQFYTECIAPELIRSNLKKNKKCVDPPYIQDAIAQNNKRKLSRIVKTNAEDNAG